MIQLNALPKFYRAVNEHRDMEQEIHRLLRCNIEKKYIAPNGNKAGILRYAQKNFFSILFLSIYEALGLPRERRLFYGQINHCLRGLVTGTDNLLDNEYKEMLPLAFPKSAIRFKSVMHILLFDRFLTQIVERAAGECLINHADKDSLHKKLFEALVPIGAEESMEEGGITEILTPEEILSSVHIYKGGKLLCLAFVAPSLLEEGAKRELQLAEKGIYSIGIALQLIDDLTDFYEDIEAKNHNYLVSSIYHRGSENEKQLLVDILNDQEGVGPVESAFKYSTSLVMREAIGEAMRGFEMLNKAGYWMNRSNAYKLIRHLFLLRGVENLMPLFPLEREFKNDNAYILPGQEAVIAGSASHA